MKKVVIRIKEEGHIEIINCDPGVAVIVEYPETSSIEIPKE